MQRLVNVIEPDTANRPSSTLQPHRPRPDTGLRETRPDVKLGICGEHGGDPASIDFCEMVGLDYVSCSPYRVPIARLAAAQAALGEREKDR